MGGLCRSQAQPAMFHSEFQLLLASEAPLLPRLLAGHCLLTTAEPKPGSSRSYVSLYPCKQFSKPHLPSYQPRLLGESSRLISVFSVSSNFRVPA